MHDTLQNEFDNNLRALTLLGLPPLVVPTQWPLALCLALPQQLLVAHTAGLVLEARIVDFWEGSAVTRTAISSWLQGLGFNVTVTANQHQIDVACGYVAARATNLMFAAGHDFCTVDVSDAVDQCYVDIGNAYLENDSLVSVFLETQDVLFLTQQFRELAFPDEPVMRQADVAYPCMQWPLTVGSLDWVARRLAETFMSYVGRSDSHEPSRAFFITNTQDCRGPGSHWISVAISMRWDHS